MNRGRISRRGFDRYAGWCGACGWSRKPSPGGPGRPSGSYYGEPAIAGRHGRDERRESLGIARFIGNGSEPKIAAKSAQTAQACLRMERRGACARMLSATTSGRTPPALKVRCLRQRCGLRSNGSVQRRSAPPAFFRGSTPPGPLVRRSKQIEATHPGRKTGRIRRGCLTT
jgi:hypothetical protein